MTTSITPQRLPIHLPRKEDVDLIDRWLRARLGTAPEPITIAEIYKSDNAPPKNFWSEVHCSNVRYWMLAFAKRARLPLREIGLLPGGGFSVPAAREEIQAYAADYAARNADRLTLLATRIAERERKHLNVLPWRTRGWIYFVAAATEFYNFLERQGLRPTGSNPLLGILASSPISLSKDIVIIESWYKKIFDYPKTLKQSTIILLLANGLRCSEVCEARAAEFTYSQHGDSTLRIIGKGNKVRTVYLYDATATSVYYWIQARRFLASPWMFPGEGSNVKPGAHMTRFIISNLIKRICLKVFPDDAHIRGKITPHKLRHYYTSDALYRGIKPAVVQAQLGHATLAMTGHYTHMDPEWVRKEIQAVNQGGLLNVPRRYDRGTPQLLVPRERRDTNGTNGARQHDIPLW